MISRSDVFSFGLNFKQSGPTEGSREHLTHPSVGCTLDLADHHQCSDVIKHSLRDLRGSPLCSFHCLFPGNCPVFLIVPLFPIQENMICNRPPPKGVQDTATDVVSALESSSPPCHFISRASQHPSICI
ncbi:unnamed protein product [Caenorhabditis auriculariae]|uniref:Uncharacterized protein n=1 Tax=Caenorhabditis auriculariae TaxID=2777116 RepID=A0A8S1HN44_9PELO|nr:unnamed protein product [Caenorhabditis auriculariae]